mmetsp:Transcript_12744/g.32583  ORF Transcript_12744/g.32583 Transcript_12744/m.32583 type:complete len:250 (-) Transcript_12744:1733-2482(-)
MTARVPMIKPCRRPPPTSRSPSAPPVLPPSARSHQALRHRSHWADTRQRVQRATARPQKHRRPRTTTQRTRPPQSHHHHHTPRKARGTVLRSSSRTVNARKTRHSCGVETRSPALQGQLPPSAARRHDRILRFHLPTPSVFSKDSSTLRTSLARVSSREARFRRLQHRTRTPTQGRWVEECSSPQHFTAPAAASHCHRQCRIRQCRIQQCRRQRCQLACRRRCYRALHRSSRAFFHTLDRACSTFSKEF